MRFARIYVMEHLDLHLELGEVISFFLRFFQFIMRLYYIFYLILLNVKKWPRTNLPLPNSELTEFVIL